MRFTVAILAIVAAAPVGVGEELTPRQKGDLAIQARGILRKYCGECHGGNEPTSGRVTVLDSAGLTRNPGPVPFVSPTGQRSQVLEFLEDGSMPPGGRPRPTAAEVAVVKAWVDAAAPSYPKAFDDEEAIGRWIRDDFLLQPKADRPFLRYLSFAHLVPEFGPPAELRRADGALRKALLVANDKKPSDPPVPVDDAATLFRFDLRTVGWLRPEQPDLFDVMVEGVPRGVMPLTPFDLILLEYPHAPSDGPAALADIVKDWKQARNVPYLRADWLAAALADGTNRTPLADDVLSLVRLAGGDQGPGPEFRPFQNGKPVVAAVPPLGAWTTADVSAERPPFALTAKLIDQSGSQVAKVKLNEPFQIRAECDRAVRLTLLSVFGDGKQVLETPIASGDLLDAGAVKRVFEKGTPAFVVASIDPQDRKSMPVHYLLFAAEGDAPPGVTVVRSRHTDRPVWRVLPKDPAAGVVRKVLTVTVER